MQLQQQQGHVGAVAIRLNENGVMVLGYQISHSIEFYDFTSPFSP